VTDDQLGEVPSWYAWKEDQADEAEGELLASIPLVYEEALRHDHSNFLRDVEALAKQPYRTFPTGASRDTDEGKPDFEGFLSPLVLTRFGEYMHHKRHMPDGTLRSGDNWQKGMTKDVYISSAYRHFIALTLAHDGYKSEPSEESLCALLFNIQGYLHELLKERNYLGSQPVNPLPAA